MARNVSLTRSVSPARLKRANIRIRRADERSAQALEGSAGGGGPGSGYEPIYDITLSNATIPENSAPGTPVGVFTSVPPGATFTLVDDGGDRFDISGVTLVGGAVSGDYETQPTVDITVRADMGFKSREETFTITYTDVSEIGTITLSPNQITENSSAGTLVGTLTANPINATISMVDNAGGRFAISGGNLVAGATKTDYENTPNPDHSYNVTLRATLGPDHADTTLKVFVVNAVEINNITLTPAAINENSGAGTVVGTLASLPTAGATWTLTDSAGGRFAISGNTVVAGSVPTDYETATSHDITVQGVMTGEAFSKTFTIQVNNVNEITNITLSGTTVTENAAAGAFIGTLASVPSGATLSLTDNAGNRFALAGSSLNTGTVATNYETASSHQITVQAVRGPDTFSKNFTINVSDVDEISDIFLSGTALQENSAQGTQIGTLSSSPTGATFSLTDNAGGRIQLVGSSIQAGPVNSDYESATSYQITVRGTRQSETLDKNFTINIGDVNEAPPPPDLDSFGLSGNSIQENSGAGTYVGTLSSSPAGASYVLTGSAGGRFALSGSNIVAGSTPTDYETATSHSISVQATRGATTLSDSFTINVTDVSEGGGGGGPTLTPSAGGSSASGFGLGAGNQAVTTGVQVTISGSNTPYSFDWELVSGDSQIYNATTSSGTTGRSGDIGYWYMDMADRPADRNAVWRCKVTDSTGAYGYTNNVSVHCQQT